VLVASCIMFVSLQLPNIAPAHIVHPLAHVCERTRDTRYNFSGYIVSDCGGVADVVNPRYPARRECIANVNGTVHNDPDDSCFLAGSSGDASTMAMNAGTDLDCGSVFTEGIAKAVASGAVSETRVRLSVERLFEARLRLGEFDPPDHNPYASTHPRLKTATWL
jgi:beta-glucosidase-like glycosyl hydrolase